MVDFIGRREGTHIVPASVLDLEELEKVRRDHPVHVSISFNRSLRHNNWFHKLLDVVADGLGMHPATLKAELKFKAGLIDQIFMSPKFGIAVQLESVAFSAMDEIKFTDRRRIMVEVLFRDYLPGIKRKDVYRKVEELTGEKCPW